MTREEVYDLALKRYKEPALCVFNGEHILGYWIKRSETKDESLAFTCKTQGVVIVARASSWKEVAAKAGLVILPSPARMEKGKTP